MVLSNAERQARYRERRKALLAQGVTPEMIIQVLREEWEASRIESALPPWEEYVAECRRGRKGSERWLGNVRAMLALLDYDDEELGGDPAAMRRVLAVIKAVLEPPPPEGCRCADPK